MGFLLCPIRKHYLKQVNSPSNFTSSFFFFGGGVGAAGIQEEKKKTPA